MSVVSSVSKVLAGVTAGIENGSLLKVDGNRQSKKGQRQATILTRIL